VVFRAAAAQSMASLDRIALRERIQEIGKH
jgi:hypothetical protein